MTIPEFQNRFSDYPIFSLQDIQKVVPNFHRIQIDRWEKKGYVLKVKQGYYSLAHRVIDRNFLWYTANRIYSPSYISLESALKWYGLIPEEVFQVTSVSTRKTTNFATPIGNFSYRNIRENLFFGYTLMDFENQKILMAEPEKAILDYLYLHPNLKAPDDFLGIRINRDEFKKRIRIDVLKKYLEVFGNQSLNKRTEIFLNTLDHDSSR